MIGDKVMRIKHMVLVQVAIVMGEPAKVAALEQVMVLQDLARQLM
jgi:hypothetical protein